MKKPTCHIVTFFHYKIFLTVFLRIIVIPVINWQRYQHIYVLINYVRTMLSPCVAYVCQWQCGDEVYLHLAGRRL